MISVLIIFMVYICKHEEPKAFDRANRWKLRRSATQVVK